MSFFRVI